jgi:hypothetical protein
MSDQQPDSIFELKYTEQKIEVIDSFKDSKVRPCIEHTISVVCKTFAEAEKKWEEIVKDRNSIIDYADYFHLELKEIKKGILF